MASKISPNRRLINLLRVEREDLMVLTAYTVAIILLVLAVPLAMQALVNTVAAGIFLQPLIVLTLLVATGLGIAGIMQVAQISLVEVIQQRVFARTAIEIAERLAQVKADALREEYAPELVNRFFDVLTIQKSISKLMVDGFTAALTAFIGILVLGFYNPVLLLLDLIIVLMFVFGVFILGFNGLRTSITESKEKYRVAEWLEDIARCHSSVKIHGERNFLTSKADQLVTEYIHARRAHFKVNRRQLLGHFLFVALASAGVLGSGGWLVINGQLTLGQLVAAQIIVSTILVSLDKLVRQADTFYDLLTGLDKVGHITDLPVERTNGVVLPRQASAPGASVVCRGVQFAYREHQFVLDDLNFTLKPGERVSLVGASGAGKSTLASILCGLEAPLTGSAEFDGIDIREISLESLREHVGLAAFHRELFDGTVEENVRVGRPHVTHEDVRWALEMAQLTEEVARMPEGLQSRIISNGQNISRGQIQRILIARAIAGRPRLLILDEAFIGIDEQISSRILDAVFAPEHTWSIIDISHEPEVVLRTSQVHVLANGKITESGSPQELAKRPDGEFVRLFPFLTKTLAAAPARGSK